MEVWPQLQERAALGRGRGRRPTSRSRCCSGTSASSPISRRCAIARRRAGAGSSTASSRSAGAARRSHVAPLPRRLRPARRARDAARALGAQRSCRSDFAIGLAARLALDDLPAVLRRRRDLLRLRDGADADHPGARACSGSSNVITPRHLDNCAKLIARRPGWIVIYSYVVEFFLAWYSRRRSRDATSACTRRPTGPERRGVLDRRWSATSLVPQLFWWQRRAHAALVALFVIVAARSTSACGASAS